MCSLTVIRHPQKLPCQRGKLLETLGHLLLCLSTGERKANKAARLTFDSCSRSAEVDQTGEVCAKKPLNQQRRSASILSSWKSVLQVKTGIEREFNANVLHHWWLE